MKDIFEKIKKIMAENLEIDENTITLETRPKEDLKIDSLDLVELVMAFEDEFDIQIEDEALEQIETVSDIVKEIKSSQA